MRDCRANGRIFALLVLAGCSSSPRGESLDASAPGSGGPTILTFGTDVRSLGPGQTVRFVALVTHPDGLDKLVGGGLIDPTGTVNYGAFAADNQASYSLDVSWEQMNSAIPTTFDVSESRTLIGEFFDQAGRSTSRSASVELTCSGKSACSGQCVDLRTDESHCGRCDNKLPPIESCQGGLPVNEWSPCFNPTALAATCTDDCAQQGYHCGDRCGSDHMQSVKVFGSADVCAADGAGTEFATACGTSLPQGFPTRCCCTP